mgnify:CR=1 FL=1
MRGTPTGQSTPSWRGGVAALLAGGRPVPLQADACLRVPRHAPPDRGWRCRDRSARDAIRRSAISGVPERCACALSRPRAACGSASLRQVCALLRRSPAMAQDAATWAKAAAVAGCQELARCRQCSRDGQPAPPPKRRHGGGLRAVSRRRAQARVAPRNGQPSESR